LHIGHKKFRNPNRRIPIYVGFISNIFGNHFSTVVVSQNKTRSQALSRWLKLWLVGILVHMPHTDSFGLCWTYFC
jgi:hypothetical protein